MFGTTSEKMAKYIGKKFGDNAAQEWTSGIQTVLQEPAHLQVILAKHTERVKATRDRLNHKLTSLRVKKVEIESKLSANSGNCTLRREGQEVNGDIGKTQIELMDEVEMELTNDERTTHIKRGTIIASQARS